MKTKYVEPKGYWNSDMEKAFNDGKKSSKKQTSKSNKSNKSGKSKANRKK